MTDDTAPAPQDGYVPFGLDFSKLASDIRAFTSEDVISEALHGLVHAALRHVRDETAAIDEQAVARVLMTAGVLVQSLEDNNPGWNGRMIANLLCTLGQRLWDGVRALPEAAANPASRWWALWQPHGVLYAVEEFAEPQTREQVFAKLDADGEFELMGRKPVGEGEYIRRALEPPPKARAEELREHVRQVRR